jgi:hypothetical protein
LLRGNPWTLRASQPAVKEIWGKDDAKDASGKEGNTWTAKEEQIADNS